MARETKEERLVRQIFDQTSEHMHELVAIAKNPGSKELDVERWAQSVLSRCLGYSASNGYSIRSQETRGKMRPDLIVLKNEKPCLVIEVKKLEFNLDKANFRSGKTQLGEYLHSLDGVQWGIITNGYEWRLFDYSNVATGGIEILSFDVRGEADTLEASKRSAEDLAWNFVEIHETALSSGSWKDLSREATAFSPESLAKAMLSNEVVRFVAKVIRGEHEYRANADVLFDKISDMLERGLNDSVADWNDAKRAELHKHVKSQKRAARKKKKSKGDNAKDATDAAAPAQGEDVNTETAQTEIDPNKVAA